MNSKRRCKFCRNYFPVGELSPQGTCSPACLAGLYEKRRAWQRPKGPPKPTKQKNPVPQSMRDRVLLRDRHQCRWCGARNPELHHIAYRSEGKTGDNSERNLISLCAKHHALAHSNKRYWQPVLKLLISKLYDENQWLTVTQAEALFHPPSTTAHPQ